MERPGRKRQLVRRAGTGQHLVAVRCVESGMGPIRQWKLGVFAGVRIQLDFRQLLGVPAVLVWGVELVRKLWLGMGSWNGGVQSMVGRRPLWRPQYRRGIWRIPSADAASWTETAARRGIDCRESSSHARSNDRIVAGAGPDHGGEDCGIYRAALASGEPAPGVRSLGVGFCKSHCGDERGECSCCRTGPGCGGTDLRRQPGGESFGGIGRKKFRGEHA